MAGRLLFKPEKKKEKRQSSPISKLIFCHLGDFWSFFGSPQVLKRCTFVHSTERQDLNVECRAEAARLFRILPLILPHSSGLYTSWIFLISLFPYLRSFQSPCSLSSVSLFNPASWCHWPNQMKLCLHFAEHYFTYPQHVQPHSGTQIPTRKFRASSCTLKSILFFCFTTCCMCSGPMFYNVFLFMRR